MKRLLIPLLLFIGVHEVRAQADPTHDEFGNLKQEIVKNISEFGGFPNDGIDDSKALDSAARWFNESNGNINYTTQYGVLKFDSGEYVVGDQETTNSLDFSVLEHDKPKYQATFQDIDGLIIKGTGISQTKISIKQGVYFGYFQRSDISDPHIGAYANSNAVPASAGIIFLISWSAKNVQIQDMELNGNSDTYVVGYPTTLGGDWVCFSNGIYTSTMQSLSLNNLYIHNFGYDGIRVEVSQTILPSGKYHLTMDHVISKWNGRQALSWVDGRDILIENSEFSYTRIKEGSSDAISQVAGSPGSNVDIEPEPVNGPPGIIRNGTFNNCKMVGNPWPSSSLIIQLNSDSITFNRCQIKTGQNFWAAIGFVRLENRNFTFNQCDISGTIDFARIQGEMTHLPDVGFTRFMDCNISGSENAGGLGNALISVHDRVLFDRCNIKQINQRPIFQIIDKTNDGFGISNPDFYTTLNNCNISSTYVSDPSASDLRGRMYALRFTGSTKWTHDITSSPMNGQNLFFKNATLNGSSLYSPMNRFVFPNINLFTGSSYGYQVDPTWDPYAYERPIIMGETPCEYLNVYIGEGDDIGGSLMKNDERPLYIGEGTTLTVRKGSALILSGDIYLAGKIVVDAEAYFSCSQSYLMNGGYGNYPANLGPTIHFLDIGSNSIASHLIIDPNAILAPPPLVWIPGTLPANFVPETLRSQLIAPDQYLKTEARRTNKNWDDPNLQCEKCTLSQSGPGGAVLSCKYVTSSLRPSNTSVYNNDDASSINIYPNPTNDKIYISTGNTDEPSDIQLLDINGRQLYKTTSKDAETEISLSKYPQGTYLIRISNATNSVVKKVVKTN